MRAELAARASHLCSGSELLGYGVIIDTRIWLGGTRVLVPPLAIEQIDWRQRLVRVAITQAQIRSLNALELSAR